MAECVSVAPSPPNTLSSADRTRKPKPLRPAPPPPTRRSEKPDSRGSQPPAENSILNGEGFDQQQSQEPLTDKHPSSAAGIKTNALEHSAAAASPESSSLQTSAPESYTVHKPVPPRRTSSLKREDHACSPGPTRASASEDAKSLTLCSPKEYRTPSGDAKSPPSLCSREEYRTPTRANEHARSLTLCSREEYRAPMKSKDNENPPNLGSREEYRTPARTSENARSLTLCSREEYRTPTKSKDNAKPPILFSCEDESVVEFAPGKGSSDTFPRMKTRSMNLFEEKPKSKKKRKPHVIDARPTLYEVIEHRPQTWLERLRSRKSHQDSPERIYNSYSPCTEKKRPSSVPDTAPLQKGSSTPPRKPTTPPARPPPPSFARKRHSMPSTSPESSLPKFREGSKTVDNAYGAPPLPTTKRPPLPTAERPTLMSERPPLPIPVSPSSPSSPPLPSISESTGDIDDSNTTGDSGDVEEEDIEPYSIIQRESGTGRLISVFTTPCNQDSCAASKDEQEEYIYMSQWGALSGKPTEEKTQSLPNGNPACDVQCGDYSSVSKRDSGVYMPLDTFTKDEDNEYTIVRFEEKSSTSNTASPHPMTPAPSEVRSGTKPSQWRSYENVPFSRPVAARKQYENVQLPKSSSQPQVHNQVHTPSEQSPMHRDGSQEGSTTESSVQRTLV